MDTTPPSHSERRDALETVGEMVLNLVPGVGGALAVALKHRLNVNLQRRQEEWLAELAMGLNDLRDTVEGFDLDALADNDAFVDAVMTASRIAGRTSHREKLDALRNAVLSAALPGAPEDDEQHRFFTLIDDLTPTHLRMLAMLNDPQDWFEKKGKTDSLWVSDYVGVPEILGQAFGGQAEPMLSGWTKRFFEDLYRWDLLQESWSGVRPVDRVWQPWTSSYGAAFLAFIHDPRTNARS